MKSIFWALPWRLKLRVFLMSLDTGETVEATIKKYCSDGLNSSKKKEV